MATSAAGAAGVRVAHASPGRVRLRLPAGEVDTLVAEVEALPGVVDVAWSAVTRGLLVRYRPGAIDAAAIVNAVASGLDADVLAPDAAPLAPEAATPVTPSASPVAAALQATARELDDDLRRRTAGLIDLGVLVPMALGAWALLELLRGRAAPLAWSSALWYAHGLFRDYGVPPTEP